MSTYKHGPWLNHETQKVMAELCPCCGKLVLHLRIVPPKGVDPANYYRTVRCYPAGWDGNLWYTGQCFMHRWTKKLRDAIYAQEDRLD